VFKLQKSVSLSTAGHSRPNVKDAKVLVINTGGTIGMMEHENGKHHQQHSHTFTYDSEERRVGEESALMCTCD